MQTLKKTPKPLISLKQHQTDHFNSLQKKHVNDTDLIDNIRQFCKSKANADREYAQSIQKLVQAQTLKRKSITEIEDNDELNAWNIWKRLMEQFEETCTMRLNTADMLQQLTDQIKPLRNNRVSTNKRILEQLKCLQIDLYNCVQEMLKAQKVYSEDEKETYEVKIKAEDAATKVRNKSTNIFNSMADLHRNSDRLTSRLDAYQIRSTAARNEYLFQLAAINAHLKNYFHTDLPDYGEIIDANIYEKLKGIFVTITTDEFQCSQKQVEVWKNLIQLSGKVTRTYHWDNFLQKNQSFVNYIEYKFQPIKNDKMRMLVSPNLKDDTLGNVTKKLVKRLIVREHKINGYENEIKSLESGKVTPQSSILSPNPPDSEMGLEDLVSYNQEYVEHKVEELKFAIRKEQIEKVKIEACLNLLKKSGVDTDLILNDARQAIAAATEIMLMQRSSDPNQWADSMDQHSGITSSYYPQSMRWNSTSSRDHERNLEENETNSVSETDPELHSLSKDSGSLRTVATNPKETQGSSATNDNSSDNLNITEDNHHHHHHRASVDDSSAPRSYDDTHNETETDGKNAANYEQNGSGNVDDDDRNDADNESVLSYDDIWSQQETTLGALGKAIAIYEFQADHGNSEELDLVVDEDVILLSEPDKFGWIKVKSLMDGKSGIVPITYLKILVKYEEDQQQQTTLEDQCEDDPNDYINIPPPQSSTHQTESNVINSTLQKLKPVDSPSTTINNEDLVRAAYAFSGLTQDELKLEKNDVIKIITRLSNEGVDDGWWEGYRMQWDSESSSWKSTARGFFPSMVVVKYIPDSSNTADISEGTVNVCQRKRPSVKLDLSVGRQKNENEDNQKQDENIPESSSSNVIGGDYVRLASEEEKETNTPENEFCEIKEI